MMPVCAAHDVITIPADFLFSILRTLSICFVSLLHRRPTSSHTAVVLVKTRRHTNIYVHKPTRRERHKNTYKNMHTYTYKSIHTNTYKQGQAHAQILADTSHIFGKRRTQSHTLHHHISHHNTSQTAYHHAHHINTHHNTHHIITSSHHHT